MKFFSLIFLSVLLSTSVFLSSCGVKRLPSPAYTTGLPFEEESTFYHSNPSPTPSSSPLNSPGLKQ